MAFPSNNEQIEEIKRRVDIVEVINARVTLRRSGSTYSACCPFHKEKTPSFHVNPSRQMFKCFGCGEAGDVFAFLMKHDGLTFVDALKMLAERTGVQLRMSDGDGRGELRKRLYHMHAELADLFHRTLLESPDAAAARKYLEARGFGREAVEMFQIGFAPRQADATERWAQSRRYTEEELLQGGVLSLVDRSGSQYLYDRFRGRLMFPILDSRGRVVAFSGRLLEQKARAAKYVNSAESPIFTKSQVLYGLHKAQRGIVSAPGRQALVCEGQIDVIRCHMAGFDNTVASQGTAFTRDHVALLKRYADSAVLVFDSDSAGQKAAISTARLFLSAGVAVRIARLPEGEDPDSIIRGQGAETFRKLIEDSIETVPFQTQWLQAQERDPRSSEALGRISAELIETLLACDNAVHQARMLQEASELLALPTEALAAQLSKAQEEARAREARQMAGSASRWTKTPRSSPSYAGMADPLMDTYDDLMDGVGTIGAGAELSGGGLPRMKPGEQALCELLLHNMDDEALIRMVDEHLTAELFAHPYAARVSAAVFETICAGRDALLDLQENGDEGVVEFIRRIVTEPVRSGGNEFSPLEIARDLILVMWRDHLEREIAIVREEGGADAELQRMKLRMELQKLRSWDTGVQTINKLRNKA